MDENVWHPEDKAWLASREREWRQVRENLTKMSPSILRKHHKFHKELFFYGRAGDDKARASRGEDSPFDFALPFFELWYYPGADENTARWIYEKQEGPFRLGRARELLFLFSPADFATDYGMLGGREALAVRMLFPGLDCDEERPFPRAGKGYRLSMRPRWMLRYCAGQTSALLHGGTPINPYAPGQYLWDHLDYGLAHHFDYLEAVEDWEWAIMRLKRALRMVVDFDVRSGAPKGNPAAVGLRERLLARFEARDFAPRLMGYWDEVKAAFEAGEPPPE